MNDDYLHWKPTGELRWVSTTRSPIAGDYKWYPTLQQRWVNTSPDALVRFQWRDVPVDNPDTP